MSSMTLAEKILAKNINTSHLEANQTIMGNVDCAMMDDILGPRILNDSFEELGAKIWDKEKFALIADHYTPPATVQQANIVSFTRKWAQKHHIGNYFEGIGPCHQVLAENGFCIPNTLLVGTDSHTCTAGAFGCFGTGIGSTEMLGVLATGQIWLKVPESILLVWNGMLPTGVMAKDLILKVIGDIGHSGATYMAMEFRGSTISGLPMDERMCISNMCVEAGAKVGLIEADSVTEAYLKKHGYRGEIAYLKSDADAKYTRVLTYQSENLVPQVSCPHEVDNVKPIDEVEKTPVHKIYIGSCTGGRLNDLKMAAQILKGKKVAQNCTLHVSPASQKIWREAAALGYLSTLAEAGAIILAPTCGACLGIHSGLLADGENCISTSNRNFRGRMGSKDANVYLGSPATAAASAVAGYLADSRNYV